jgi:raffinose/stachyose/melibiose transport system substrate-binding protein
MKNRLSLLIVLLFILTFVLAACSGGSKDGVSSSPGVSAAQEKVKLTITSWRSDQNEFDVYKKISAEFNKKYPNIEIDYKPVKATEYNTALNTALKTDTAADIIHLRPYNGAKTMADAKYVDPLDSLKGIEVFSKDNMKAVLGSDGKPYGVPHMLSSTQIFYNKKIFAKYNLQEPKTWDELINVAKKLKDNKVTPFSFGSKEGWIISLTHGAIGPQFYGGADFVNKFLDGSVKLDSPQYLKSIDAMNDLVPYFPDNFVGISMDDMRNMFVTEQAAMMIMGNWETGAMKKMNPALEMDAFPIPPTAAGGKATVTTWVDGAFGVNAKSQHKEEAKKFLEFMTTKEYGSILVENVQAPSAIPGITTQDPLVNKLLKLSSENATPYMAVINLSSGNPTTKVTMENNMQGMYLKKVSAKQVTEEMQKSADSWFKVPAK